MKGNVKPIKVHCKIHDTYILYVTTL